jgi:antitoxin HicB
MSPRVDDYPVEIRPLSAEEGGGFLATFPDLPGCMADGETPEAALAEARDAFACWMDAHQADGRPVPLPNTASGKFIQRLPKSLHARLQGRAKAEGVSVNQLVTAYIAEGLGAARHHRSG